MAQAKDGLDTGKKKQVPAGYLDGSSNFGNNGGGGGGSSSNRSGGNNSHDAGARAAHTGTTMPPAPATEREAIPSDLPPAYSFSDPNMLPAMPPQFSMALSSGSPDALQDLKVDQKRASELVATKAFAFDRPVFIHASNVSSTTLVIEPDTNLDNADAIVVIAEVTSLISGLDNKCSVTATVNELNEYDFYVCSTASMWSLKSINCRFVVRVPSTRAGSHPGIRAAFANGRADMSYINNINFGFIDLKTTCGDVALTNVQGGSIRVSTTRGVLKASNVVAADLCEMLTTNCKVTLVDVRAQQVNTKTSNSSITLTTVAGEAVLAETSNGKIDCTNISAVNVKLTTTNSSIDTNHVAATNLYLNTRNAKIEGTWRIKNLLDVVTTNSKIVSTILLQDPLEPVTIRLSTTNSKIQAYLPAESFRGVFDAKTSNSKATVQAHRTNNVGSPPIQYIINDKSYKRGTIGSIDSTRHQFSASTTNSGIEVRLV
ncbi:hypothetical protein IWW47_003813 [Coemansia sp. RSA 2052]|nr:hypothetical protein IWW47_003813 [Coemansia sp. RSA 2052]